MNDSATDSMPLNQKAAEQIIRMFNVGFNSALLYGGDHPTTIKNAGPFISLLIKELEQVPLISIIIDRESLFLDEYCSDKIINPKRIITQFTKSSIQSVSFERGVRENDILEFLKYAGDIKTIHSAEQIASALKSSGCHGIRLNHIHYGKITSDETLISKNAAASQNIPGATLSKQAVDEIERIISLAKLVEQPQETADALKKSMNNDNDATAAVNAISKISTEIKNAEPQSVESLLNAVFELKMDLSEALAAQKLTGKILASADPVQKQMDNLTCEVLVKLVKEEYSNGDVSLKRLAQIIRRMMPETSELKRVLPLLKSTLLSEGMSLSDYLQLLRLIDLEIESESLVTILDDAAAGIGATADEVVKAIKAQPGDAAKLMFLAAEIRHGTEQDDAQLSNMLTEYVEKVSSSIALDSKEISGPQGSQVLGKIISHVEDQLVNKLKVYGIDEPVLHQIKAQLEKRFNSTIENTATQWMLSNVAENGFEPTDLIKKMSAFMGSEQLSTIKDPLVEALVSRGFEKDQIDKFMKELSVHISAGKKIILPANVLSSNNMMFLLNREIKQHLRFNTPFSTLFVSIYKILTDDGNLRTPQQEEISELIPALFTIVKKLLRDIDLIGTLGGKDESSVFAILTLTAEDGAKVVRNRIINHINSIKFTLQCKKINLITIISITSPVNDATINLNTFLDLARKNHNYEYSRMQSS